MNISKTHKHYSERLKNHRVLINPEEFLGPNFEAVLNFWLILDGLSKDQWEIIDSRYYDFWDNQYSEWDKAATEADKASNETIGRELAGDATWATWAARIVYGGAADYATSELIGMHKFFERQKPLTFFPMFLEVL